MDGAGQRAVCGGPSDVGDEPRALAKPADWRGRRPLVTLGLSKVTRPSPKGGRNPVEGPALASCTAPAVLFAKDSRVSHRTPKQKEPSAPFHITGGCAAPYSASNLAYAVTSHLAPTSSNWIWTRLCWPTPSKFSTMPSPNFGCSTRWPSLMPLASKLCCTSFWLKRPYWVWRLT